MGMKNRNLIDDTTLEFPQAGFWIIHVLGTFFLLFVGMHLVFRRAPLPLVALSRLLRAIR